MLSIMADALKPRSYRLTPDRLILGLLAVEALLWLSERFQSFAFNTHKGWTVLIAVASIGVFLLLMLFWFAISLLLDWRFQFSIRSLLFVVVVVALPFSWLAVEMKKPREQNAAVAGIRKLGGVVGHDWEFEANGIPDPYKFIPLLALSPPAPAWLRNLLGDDFFTEVVDVTLDRTKLTGGGMKDLALASSFTHRPKVTDAGLEHVKALTQLRNLDLSGTQVTDAGLEHLKSLTQMDGLSLDDTHVTGGGLAYLGGLSKLQRLYLDGTDVTDAGLENVKEFGQLYILTLQNTKVTDAGLKHLEGLTQLRGLWLVGTKVTKEGVKTLQRALPNCEIYH
jgi:hypothetical protein